MTFKLSYRTRIMYAIKWTGNQLADVPILILAGSAWLLLYTIYFTSGIKVLVHKDIEWKEQMEWKQ